VPSSFAFVIENKELRYFDIRDDIDDEAGRVSLPLNPVDKPLHDGVDGDVCHVGYLHLVDLRFTQFFFENLADGDALEAVLVDQVVDVLALLRSRTAKYEHDRRRQIRYLYNYVYTRIVASLLESDSVTYL